MQKLLLAFLLLGHALDACAQRLMYGQRLAAVHSVKSAQEFLRSIEFENTGTELDSLGVWQQEHCFVYQIHSDSIAEADADPCFRYRIVPSISWTKADFDQDGQVDLFVVGDDGRSYCILGRGAKLPIIIPLMLRGWIRDCRYYRVVQLGSLPAVVHWDISYLSARNRQRGHEPQMWQDTLVYHDGAFVEYNPHPAQPLPKSISYSQGGSITSTFSYGVDINLKSGKATSNVLIDRVHNFRGKVVYRLTTGVLDTLQRRLAYLDVAHLDTAYGIGGFDHNVHSLTFHYPNKQLKEIDDYGGVGTYGLNEIYGLIRTAQVRGIELLYRRHPALRPKLSSEE